MGIRSARPGPPGRRTARKTASRRAVAALLAGCGAALGGCGTDRPPPAPTAPSPEPVPELVVNPFAGDDLETRLIGGSRQARLLLPAGTRATTPLPLVINLHGFGSTGRQQDLYFGMSPRAAESGFALVIPDGTVGPEGRQFWNATDFCCDFGGSGVDDVAYLADLVREAEQFFTVSGVFLAGMSNGGFMAYRAACDGAVPGLAGVLVVAGSSWLDPARCAAPSPVSVLHLHGTADETIRFAGAAPSGDRGGHPGAEEVTRRWAERAGCDLSRAESGPRLDLDFEVAGAETSVRRYRRGCRGGRVVELWTLEGSAHVPDFGAGVGRHFADWIALRAR